jgi:hypothetical protein
MAKFPESCTECGFLFDTTTDHDQSFIDEHLAAHLETHGLEDKAAKEAEEARAAFIAEEERRVAEAINSATPAGAPLSDFQPTSVEDTI